VLATYNYNLTWIKAGVGQFVNCTALAASNSSASTTRFALAEPSSSFVYAQIQGDIVGLASLGQSGLPVGMQFDSRGALTGAASRMQALSVYPIVAVTYPSSAPAPGNFSAKVAPNGTIFVSAWNRSGVVDPSTGLMQPPFAGQTQGLPYAPCEAVPVFSPQVAWLGLNPVIANPVFQPPQQLGVVVSAFSSVGLNQKYFVRCCPGGRPG
jgi:hypothetical protein